MAGLSPGMKRLLEHVPDGLMRKKVKMPDGFLWEFRHKFLTLAQREKAKQDAGDNTQEFAIRLIIDLSVEPDGVTKSFNDGDMPILRTRVPASVADDIITELVKTEFQEDEGAADPKSTGG